MIRFLIFEIIKDGFVTKVSTLFIMNMIIGVLMEVICPPYLSRKVMLWL